MTDFKAIKSGSQNVRFWAFLGTLLISSILFLLIPLTQGLNDPQVDVLEYRKVELVSPPPPEFDPPEVEPKDTATEMLEEEIQLEKQIEDIPLQKIEFSLNPGMGVGLAMGRVNMPQIATYNVTSDIEKIFDFDELVQPPTLLNANEIRMHFPKELLRRRIRQVAVTLQIQIDKTGRVSVNKVLDSSYSHPSVREAATKVAVQARFSITQVNGKPVTVKGRFPITLQAPR